MSLFEQIAAVGFWACAALVAYTYFLYPALIWCLSRLAAGVPAPPPAVPDDELPKLAVLVAAYNEESVIGQRLRNAIALDYPPERMQIVVGSDGSSDGTAGIVKATDNPRVSLLDYAERRGKASVLNSALREISATIVIFSDANTDIDVDAARKLVRWFADPTIGVVCGRLILTDPQTGRNVDSLYWKFETFLKKCESRLGALLGSNGAIYAMRRELYRDIPPDTIVDDFVIPLLARLHEGCRIVYDADAVAREQTPQDISAEYRRRVRIGAGGFQSISLLWRLLLPRNGWVAFTFLSHKVLRWLCPFFMIGGLLSALLLRGHVTYRLALLAQVLFYACSVLMAYVPTRVPVLRALRLTTMFTSMNMALLVGFFRWARGTQRAAWQRTRRDHEPLAIA